MKWAVFFLILLTPAALEAQTPPVEPIPPGEDRIASVSVGQPAPFTGQLFDPLTALRWANWLQQYKYRLELDVGKEREMCSVEKAYRDELLAAEEKRAQKVEQDLFKRLAKSEKARLMAEEELRNPPWYSSAVFGVVVGAVASAVVFGMAIAAIDAAVVE